MLTAKTPFPNVGSYALLIDDDQPLGQNRAELVRIQRHVETLSIVGGEEARVLVSFPLREGASGTKTVPFCTLIDGTALSSEEGRELTDLCRELRGLRVRDRATKHARRDALHLRAVWAPHMLRLLDQAHRAAATRKAA